MAALSDSEMTKIRREVVTENAGVPQQTKPHSRQRVAMPCG